LQEYLSGNYKIINSIPFPVETSEITDYDLIVNDFSEGNP
jgi:hypothetical protein